jgi:hypothetical protein
MESRQHIENFLSALESDLCPDILVWGEVDKMVLSASPPDATQLWRLLQIVRIQLLDLKETLEKKDAPVNKKKTLEEEKNCLSPPPKRQRKKKPVPSVDEN